MFTLFCMPEMFSLEISWAFLWIAWSKYNVNRIITWITMATNRFKWILVREFRRLLHYRTEKTMIRWFHRVNEITILLTENCRKLLTIEITQTTIYCKYKSWREFVVIQIAKFIFVILRLYLWHSKCDFPIWIFTRKFGLSVFLYNRTIFLWSGSIINVSRLQLKNSKCCYCKWKSVLPHENVLQFRGNLEQICYLLPPIKE